MRSSTTDMGVERCIAKCPNVLPEFARRLGLECSPEFCEFQHLFPLCAQIPDWDHTPCSLLSNALNDLDRWPGGLQCIRELTRFFRISDYRLTMRIALEKAGGCPIMVASLQTFTSSFSSSCDTVRCSMHLRAFFGSGSIANTTSSFQSWEKCQRRPC